MADLGVINLYKFKFLFRDDAAYEEFIGVFRESLRYDLRTIMSKDEVLGLSLSDEGAKEVLYSRLARAISRNPELVDKLAARIEDDEVVQD
jgi:hypothetical protein